MLSTALQSMFYELSRVCKKVLFVFASFTKEERVMLKVTKRFLRGLDHDGIWNWMTFNSLSPGDAYLRQ